MKKRCGPLVACATALALCLAGCSFFPAEEATPPPPIVEQTQAPFNTMEVTTGLISLNDRRRGSLVPHQEHNLSFPSRGGYLLELNVSAGVRVKKGDVLAAFEVEDIEREMQEQWLQVSLAQIDYDDILEALNGDLEDSAVRKAQIVLDMARLRYSNLRAELNNATITAPIDGIVSYVASVKVGDYVDARKTVVTVADDTQLYAMIGEVSGQAKLEEIPLGREVQVEFPTATLAGEVVVTPANAPADATFSTSPYALVRLETLPEGAKMGDSVYVQFFVEEKDNVVVVPYNAVTQYPSYAYVQVVVDGFRQERPVELGIITPTEIEIVSGLEAGETIVVR